MPIIEVTEPRRYHKPIALPERLDLLTGPTTGVVVLPRRLQWSGNARYDLDSPGRMIALYRTVIHEAMEPEDLYEYLNARVVKRLWTGMYLGPYVRPAWEQRFPELAELSRIAAAA
jgi:hypothetical protein